MKRKGNSALAPDPKTSASQPLFFINQFDENDKRSIGTYAQLASHRRRRERKIAVVAPSKKSITKSGPLAWRQKNASRPWTDLDPTVLLSPQTPLGAGRTNPFRTYPIEPGPQIDHLVDHLATAIGPQMCGYKPNPHFEFMRDRSLQLAMRDAASFHTVLSMARSHLDAMNGQKPGIEARWHRTEAIRLVNRYLLDPILCTSDRTIFSVAMLMAQERIWSAEAVVEAIGKGLDTIIQQRGGLVTLRRSSKLEFALYTIVLASPILSPHGALALYGLSQTNPCASPDDVSQYLADELINLMETIRTVVLRPSSPYGNLPFAFKMGTPVYKLLTAPAIPRHGWVGGWMMQERNRLATLLHLHLIVLEVETSPESISHYARQFRTIQQREDIWANSLEMLHHLVVKHERDVRLDCPDRSWKVLRVVNTALKLTPYSYQIFRSFLFNCLSDRVPLEEWRQCLQWHPQSIRDELMAAFQESYSQGEIPNH